MTMFKRVIGIDPGSRYTGYGLLDYDCDLIQVVHYGTIRLPLNQSYNQRLICLGLAIREICSFYVPVELAIESVFLGKNVDSAFKLGGARGVCVYESGLSGAKIYEYSTRLVKKGLTGNGSADKEHVNLMVKARLGLSELNELDTSDALALALHHIYCQQVPIQLKGV